MSKYDVPDCLVLKFEEVERETKQIDNTIYVFYDKRTHNFFVRGRRRWTPTTQSCTYSFQCEYAKDLADFLQYTICKNNTVNEVLYNYDNLPFESNDVTFEFLHDYDHGDYEISGYDNVKLKRKDLLINLRMLRNVFNFYK
jgi:hypothetical protein